MQNRWSESDAAAAAQAASCENSPALLTYATRLLGSEPDLALHGGGNTSCKGTLLNLLGEEQSALFIKASGVSLATIQPSDFVALDLAYLTRLLNLAALSDEAMAGEFACHCLRPSSRRASVETLLHAVLPHGFVLHTHPSAILALTNRTGGAEAVTAALGQEIAVVAYARVGLDLAHAVRDAMARRPRAHALVLMHHGLVTWGATVRAAYDATIELVSRAETYLEKRPVRSLGTPPAPTSDREEKYLKLAPIIRGALGPKAPDALGDRVILQALLDPEVMQLLDAPEGKKLALSAPLTPDYLIRTRRVPLWLDYPILDDAKAFKQQLAQAVAAFAAEYQGYVRRHAGEAQVTCSPAPHATSEPRDFLPRVLMIPGLGVVCIGKSAADAAMIRDITRQGLAAKTAIYQAGAEYVPLDDQHLFDMEFREYQQAKAGERGLGDAAHDLHGSVALVTGAAGAIGSGICEALLEQGCHVAATDLFGPALDGLVAELVQRYPSRVVAVPMDVTDPASVIAGFAKIIRTWGGLDCVIVNAGIAHVAPLTELGLDAFRRLESVNVEGTLLVLAEAGRHFALQGTGGDVVLISTKNVFAPGAGFGAYSATKAAAHQLARVASLELAPIGVRVNMVAPDAVFSHGQKRSGLWAAVGPNRMKARGLDERGLEEYYRSRNLLKAQVTAEDVARAVLFFITRQTPTTGATIPVDGGLPDATPR
jgi:rhamnose utilization protein RhaD (predicted bifunctional aldolase and dehydrogenase)/NAD(P)-dependent dehydrogenase (short-subunit alcohol dehydrogenase family)